MMMMMNADESAGFDKCLLSRLVEIFGIFAMQLEVKIATCRETKCCGSSKQQYLGDADADFAAR